MHIAACKCQFSAVHCKPSEEAINSELLHIKLSFEGKLGRERLKKKTIAFGALPVKKYITSHTPI